MNIPIFDGHNDTLLSFYNKDRGDAPFSARTEIGHIDYPRAIEGNFAGGFFAMFSANSNDLEDIMALDDDELNELMQKPLPARAYAPALHDTMAMANILFKIERDLKDKFKVVRNITELKNSIVKKQMAAIFHIEGAEAIDQDLNSLEVLYQAGLRSLGIVWSRPNIFANGVPFAFPNNPNIGDGLTELGKELVKECNRLGIMIDLSHLNAKGFWDVAKLSNAPLVATHSNVHAICSSPRNLLDDQLEAIRESDGMVGLNFAVSFLWPDGTKELDMPLEVMVRHIDYLVNKLGIDKVGFGSDFDGANITNRIKDVSGLPNLLKALNDAGYDKDSLEKIAYKNWLRVLDKTWK